MTNLTEMEREVLDAITKDNFYENGLDSRIWSDCFLSKVQRIYGIESKKVRGVLASLVKKNIIEGIDDTNDRFGRPNGTIAFTDYGKELMLELGYSE